MTSADKSKGKQQRRRERLEVTIALALDEPGVVAPEVVGQFAKVRCPSSEDLAAFADGLLAESKRSSILTHLDSCSRCYRQLLAVSAAHDLAAKQEKP